MKAIIALILADLCYPAYADTVTPALFFAHSSTIDSNNPGVNTETICDAANRCETTTIDLSYDGVTGMASVSGSETDHNSPKSFGGGQVEYFFGVLAIGPNINPNVPVPLVISATGAATVTGGAQAGGGITVDAPSTGQRAIASFCAPFCGPSSINSTLTISVLPNLSTNSILLEASGTINSGGPAVYSAVMDPTISFAPGFDSTGYSLIFSPSPPTGVPEPASVILLGVGLLGLCGSAKLKFLA